MANNAPATPYCGTPEDLFSIRSDVDPGLPVDALLCALSRARAVLSLASCQFTNPDTGRWCDGVISAALWSVEGDLALIEQMVEFACGCERRAS